MDQPPLQIRLTGVPRDVRSESEPQPEPEPNRTVRVVRVEPPEPGSGGSGAGSVRFRQAGENSEPSLYVGQLRGIGVFHKVLLGDCMYLELIYFINRIQTQVKVTKI